MAAFAPKDPDSIGVAVLGAGRMGRTHVRNIAAIPNARVVVVGDPDGDAAARGCLLARAQRASADPVEAILDPDVEAVVVVTPTSTHAGLIETALNAGKAVWCEKPIAQDLAETARIVDLWRATGIPVQLDFLLTAGGSFLDMAIHDLDLARFLVGEVEEVHAWASVLFDDRFAQADDFDTAVTMLRFRSGALGVVETARHSAWGYDVRTEVAGALGKVVVDGTQKTPATHLRRVASERDLYESFPDRFETAFRRELEAFFEALGAGRTPVPGPDDALEALRLAVAATRSWRENRPVPLEEVR